MKVQEGWPDLRMGTNGVFIVLFYFKDHGSINSDANSQQHATAKLASRWQVKTSHSPRSIQPG